MGWYQSAGSGGLLVLPTGLVERSSAGGWTAAAAPLPAGTKAYPSSMLNAVVCASASDCLAAGEFQSHVSGVSGPTQGLLETGIPSVWTPQAAASLVSGLPGADLFGLACPTGRYCVIVGSARSATAGGAVVATVPRVLLSPRSAAPGATVTVRLYGFSAGAEVVVHWRGVNGRTLATAATDASGAAGASFVVPAIRAGTYRVYALQPGVAAVAASLTVS